MLLIVSWIAYALIGIFAGLMAGLLGLSGGVITVPCLFFLFKWLGLPQYTDMHLAIGTSLAAMILNATAATWYHHQKHGVLWNVVAKMTPGIMIGSAVGAFVSYLLPEGILEIIFALFLCLLSMHFFKKTHPHVEDAKLPGFLGLSSISFGIGGLSNILGIGGGIITVPVLMHYKMADKNAIACSAATGTLISFLGALMYLYLGWGKAENIPYTLGYIYLPAFIIISIFSVVAARFGVKLAYHLSPPLLRRVFAFVLLITGFLMLAGA
jgi:uncharacterized membrane protein YfcA